MSDRCHVASDGTRIRMSGNPTQKQIDEMAAVFRAAIPPMCRADFGLPMPPLAQRLHGRENHICDLPPGHAGEHSWAGMTKEPSDV